MADRVIFGWGAPPIAEQFPELPADKASHFDRDNESLIRLHLRGYLTDTQRDQAIKKITKAIAKAIPGVRP